MILPTAGERSHGEHPMISRLSIALPVAILGAVLFASPASAQRRGMSSPAMSSRMGASFRSGARPGFVRPRPRRSFNAPVFLSSPYFFPGYDDDYDDYEGPRSETAPGPRVIVMQPAQAPAPVAAPSGPLVMENQGGQWTRINVSGPSPVQPQSSPSGSAQNSNLRSSLSAGVNRNEAAQTPAELPPAVLAFRDGHQEIVKKYTIKGNVIYTSADYWSTGSWTKAVPIAALDVPATLKLNAERGGKFNLPSGPGEIVVRF
jgi:hypothetical protein